MFSINIYIRFALIGVLIIGGIILAITISFWYAFPLLLTGVILALGYVFLGTVQSAAMLLQSADFNKAEERLNLTLNPNWLYSTNRAYYYMLKGSIAMSRKDTAASERYLKMAQEINIPTDNEKAMLELQLANISASKGKWKQAQIHYRKIKDLKITESTLKEQIKEFEKAMQNRGQLKAATRMGKQGAGMMRQGSGKRRRPKMR